ncbi:usher protein, partial [Escherichia coli]|nr:usher protein [Escherichia coli]
NDEVIGRAKLEVSQDDKESYCLKGEWLSDLGIIINRDFYNKYFNIKRECYEIGKEKNSITTFDNNSQIFSLYMPQAAYIKKGNTEHKWSYG